jgi:hypothetical protein
LTGFSSVFKESLSLGLGWNIWGMAAIYPSTKANFKESNLKKIHIDFNPCFLLDQHSLYSIQ